MTSWQINNRCLNYYDCQFVELLKTNYFRESTYNLSFKF